MFKQTPETKHSVMFLVLLIAFIAVSYLTLKNKVNLSELNIAEQIKQAAFSNQNHNTDDDHDGLTNQEEKQYKTDPKNPDTDHDGFLDGEEIASGHDPLKPEPNDKLSLISQTSSISQNLTRIFSLKTSKGLVDNHILAVGDTTSSNVLPDVSQLDFNSLDFQSDLERIFSLPEITASQMKIIADNSQEAVKNYSTAIIKTINKNFPPEKFNQPVSELISISFQTQEYSGFQKYTQAYQNSFNEIKNLPVPSSLAEQHRRVLNILWIFKNTFETFEQTSQDPLKSLVALNGLESIFQLLDNLKK